MVTWISFVSANFSSLSARGLNVITGPNFRFVNCYHKVALNCKIINSFDEYELPDYQIIVEFSRM